MGCIPRVISETPKEKRYPFVKIMPGGSVARRLLDNKSQPLEVAELKQ